MRYGNIKCECGQEFYFETRRDSIYCINCDKEYSTADYPEKARIQLTDEVEEGEGDET